MLVLASDFVAWTRECARSSKSGIFVCVTVFFERFHKKAEFSIMTSTTCDPQGVIRANPEGRVRRSGGPSAGIVVRMEVGDEPSAVSMRQFTQLWGRRNSEGTFSSGSLQ
jgi:hypothetical protein